MFSDSQARTVMMPVAARERVYPDVAAVHVPAPFGLTGTEYQLMKALKAEFDPEGRLNPGRHVDGERN